MLFVVQTILLLCAGFSLFYLASLSVLALLSPKKKMKCPTRFRRFALIIPAHNEEQTIGQTLRNLWALEYPQELFDVVVVADNCSDRTLERAREFGTIIHERSNLALRGKGYALRWVFDRLLALTPPYDALIVIDADTTASTNFLQVMNAYLDEGSQAIQASDLVQPDPGTWTREIIRLGLVLYNYVRPLGRRMLGLSAGLRGNGMCFAAEILRRVPWEAYSQAEDLEYSLLLLLNGITVDFAPEATVLAKMPDNPKDAESQRARWEAGRYPLIRKYSGPLLKNALKRRSLRLLDALVDLVLPPFVNLFSGVVACGGLTFLLWFGGVEEMREFVLPWALVIALGFTYTVTSLLAARADRSLYAVLLQVPRYALWKFRLYGKLLLKGHTKDWIRTARESTNDRAPMER